LVNLVVGIRADVNSQIIVFRLSRFRRAEPEINRRADTSNKHYGSRNKLFHKTPLNFVYRPFIAANYLIYTVIFKIFFLPARHSKRSGGGFFRIHIIILQLHTIYSGCESSRIQRRKKIIKLYKISPKTLDF